MSKTKQIAEALYVINKEAKKKRDEREKLKVKLFEEKWEDGLLLNEIYAQCPISGQYLTEEGYVYYFDSSIEDTFACLYENEENLKQILKIEDEEEKEEKLEELPNYYGLCVIDAVNNLDCYNFLKTGEIMINIFENDSDSYFSEKKYKDLEKKLDNSVNELKDEQHEKLRDLAGEIEELYKLKEKALNMAIKLQLAEIEGYHQFNDFDRDFVNFAGFGFHINSCDSENKLGSINNEISSERKVQTNLSIDKAIAVVNNFVNN